MKKKILSLLLALFLFVPCMFMLTACGGDDNTAKVMNVGLNPQLEFVLDKDDKVVTVNALNEDGNHIITLSLNADKTKSLFEGMTAEEAVDLFLEISEENGYLVTGNEEEIKIEISGKADQLMKKVKNKASEFFSTNGLNINIETGTISQDAIREKVKECMQEYATNNELNGMTTEQLVELLKTSRNETKDLLTQELKDAYYAMRVENLNTAEVDALVKKVKDFMATADYESLETESKTLLSGFVTAVDTLESAITALETTINGQLLAANSAYNLAKDEYIAAKKALLAKRVELSEDGISDAEKLILAGLEAALEIAETAFEGATSAANALIATAKGAIQTALTNLKNSFDIEEIKSILSDADVVLTDVENAHQNMKEGFKNHFENHNTFKDFVGKAHGHWGA